MCLSKVWLKENKMDQLIMEDVANIQVENGNIIVRSLLGEEIKLAAKIMDVDFMHSNVILSRC